MLGSAKALGRPAKLYHAALHAQGEIKGGIAAARMKYRMHTHTRIQSQLPNRIAYAASREAFIIAATFPCGLQPGVARQRDRHDDDHAHRHGIAQTRVVQHITPICAPIWMVMMAGHRRSRRRPWHRRRRRCRTAGSWIPGGRQQDGQGNAQPVLHVACTQVLGCLAPLAFQAIQGGSHDQDHQGKLEIHVGEAQPHETVEVEPVVIDVQVKNIFNKAVMKPVSPKVAIKANARARRQNWRPRPKR